MLNLKIQLFGGRGSRSGLGVGGPGIGFVDFINGLPVDIPLPENTNYPDFPDPDYSKHILNSKDNFLTKTHILLNYKRAEHDKTAEKYLKSLGLNSNIKYSNKNDCQAFGYVESGIDENGIIRVFNYNLNKADSRRMEYKVKTMFHEGYHACNDGLKDPRNGLSKPSARFHEETRTEMTAMYMANKMNDYKYVPSYTFEVISAAAKYKRIDGYKDCKTLYDLGEKFYKERMLMRGNPSYKKLDNEFKKISIDDNYYKKYYNIIKKNKEQYYEACKNSLFNYDYFNENYQGVYRNSYDNMIRKISNNERLTTALEKQHFIHCVALAMNDGGIL